MSTQDKNIKVVSTTDFDNNKIINATIDASENEIIGIDKVNDATITITQDGNIKGIFTLNQSSDATIALDAGGSSVPAWYDSENDFTTGDTELQTQLTNINKVYKNGVLIRPGVTKDYTTTNVNGYIKITFAIALSSDDEIAVE